MTDNDQPLWNAPPQPDWLRTVNTEGSYFDLPAVVPLDEASLLADAEAAARELWRRAGVSSRLTR